MGARSSTYPGTTRYGSTFAKSAEKRGLRWSEPAAEADRGRHPGFPSFKRLAGGPGSLAERSAGSKRVVDSYLHLREEFYGTPVAANVRFFPDYFYCVGLRNPHGNHWLRRPHSGRGHLS